MRLNKCADNSENSYNTIEAKLRSYNEIFQFAFIVDPFNYSIIYDSCKNNSNNCRKFCPLFNNKVGCMCRNALSSDKLKTRVTFNADEVYLVLCKRVKMQYKDLVMVLINKLDSEFTFDSGKNELIVEQITNINSEIMIDNLTKIYNRNYLNKNIDYQIKSAINNHTNMCLACIDIDNFKRFNDTYGHEFGDKVLVAVAKSMKDTVKQFSQAYPIRIGGDEFLIIIIGMTKQQFRILMTKLCQIIETTKLKYNREHVGICISIGIAELLEDDVSTYKELYNKADAQLYKAKEAGKNCVM